MSQDTKSQAKEANEGHDQDLVGGYERPVLVPMGNLHDLLAGSGTQNGDQVGPAVVCGTNSQSHFSQCP
jgi:hypothetical protein